MLAKVCADQSIYFAVGRFAVVGNSPPAPVHLLGWSPDACLAEGTPVTIQASFGTSLLPISYWTGLPIKHEQRPIDVLTIRMKVLS